MGKTLEEPPLEEALSYFISFHEYSVQQEIQ